MDASKLPDISKAKYPASYAQAKKALTACARIDECQDWADKARALGSYAKQSNDDSLRKLATRIQARAIRRCGELLEEIEPDKGGRPKKTGSGAGPSSSAKPKSRRQAAKEAGLSKRQQKTATRVAKIPEEEFEEQVESDTPPSVSALAGYDKTPGFSEATRLLGDLGRFVRFCKENDPAVIAEAMDEEEKQIASDQIRLIQTWLTRFVIETGD